MGLPTATVRMRGPDGIARTSTGMGTGPVDAAYKAIDSLVRVQVQTPTPCPHMVCQSIPANFPALQVVCLHVRACNQCLIPESLRIHLGHLVTIYWGEANLVRVTVSRKGDLAATQGLRLILCMV